MLRAIRLSALGLKHAVLVAGFVALFAEKLEAQPSGSLSELEIENSELEVTLAKSLEENERLRNALAETQKTLGDMRKNLARITSESEIFKRQAMELKLRIEALGLGSATGGSDKLEQRLLTAVSDLRLTFDENKKLAEAVVRLSEASSLFAKTATTTQPEGRLQLEAEIRHANHALGLNSQNAVEAATAPSTVSDGRAISVKDDLALVVMNLGGRQGVKVGMPFQVMRGDRLIGSIRVIDVREKISGAVIQNLYSEKDRVQVGDRLKVDARQ